MLKKIIDWLRGAWRDDAPDMLEGFYANEYEYKTYIKSKYGIVQPFAEEGEDDTNTSR